MHNDTNLFGLLTYMFGEPTPGEPISYRPAISDKVSIAVDIRRDTTLTWDDIEKATELVYTPAEKAQVQELIDRITELEEELERHYDMASEIPMIGF